MFDRDSPADVTSRFVALSIASARRTLYVTNSYFVPDDDFRKLLIDAHKRGVDVRILTVSKETDVKTTWWAGRSRRSRTAGPRTRTERSGAVSRRLGRSAVERLGQRRPDMVVPTAR